LQLVLGLIEDVLKIRTDQRLLHRLVRLEQLLEVLRRRHSAEAGHNALVAVEGLAVAERST
jgi:hypothetical protein